MRLPPIQASAPPVLVVDEGFVGSLHTAIGLRRAGCRVVLLGAVGGRSSYRGDGFDALVGVRPADAGFGAAVAAIRSRYGCDIVYPCTEPTMLALDGPRDRSWPNITNTQRELIASKSAMSAFAAAHGAAVPSQSVIHRESDLEAALLEHGLPLVLKAERGRGGDGTRIVRSADDALAATRRVLRDDGRVIAQEYVAGPTFLIGGLFRDGEALRLYAGEKLRQQPEGTGPAAQIRSVDEARLTESAQAVFRALRWTGLASMDFIRHASGRFLFLELNPRPWGSIAAAAEAGVELFEPLAALMRGGVPSSARAFRTGVTTRVLPLYLLHPAYRRSPATAARLIADLRSAQGVPFRDPGLGRHALYRLWRVRRNWPAA